MPHGEEAHLLEVSIQGERFKGEGEMHSLHSLTLERFAASTTPSGPTAGKQTPWGDPQHLQEVLQLPGELPLVVHQDEVAARHAHEGDLPVEHATWEPPKRRATFLNKVSYIETPELKP